MNYNFVFDLDGTVTKAEILPIIAKEIGLEKEMAELTRRTMDGELPFELSFTQRVDMLKDIPISKVQKIAGAVPVSDAILNFMRQRRNRCIIVTGNLDVWIEKLVEKIGITCFCSIADYKQDQLLGIKKIFNKKDVFGKILRPVAAIGDGNNDIEMLVNADIPIAYGGVHNPAPTLLEIVSHVIYDDRKLCQFLRQLS